MIRMHVIGLSVDNSSKTPMVVLQDESGQETLPIWIGAMEAMAISLALSNSALPRPLTHDLLLTALTALGGRLEAVEIHDMQQGVYHADLLLHQGERRLRIDCRPSDAIALALRVDVPIHVEPEVLRRTAALAQQDEDSASPRHMRPQDAATDMMRQAAARMSTLMAKAMDIDAEVGRTSEPSSVTISGTAADPAAGPATGPTTTAPASGHASGAPSGPGSDVAWGTAAQAGSPRAEKDEKEERRLAELLQRLEPQSSRRM